MPDTGYHQHVEALIPDAPVVDDDSAIVAAHALIELVSRRTPEALGDGLADLHALMSLLHQLQDWLPATAAEALDHNHSRDQVLAQLAYEPARRDDTRGSHCVDDMSLTQKPLSSSESS